MNAIHAMPDDVSMIQGSIRMMERAVQAAKVAEDEATAKKWETRIKRARAELARLLPPQMGG